MSDPLTINGSYLRECRESLGWSHGEVASRACLSVKQVKQLEEGGASSFYSDNVKLTAARKVASILGVSEDQLLGTPETVHEEASEDTVDQTERVPEIIKQSQSATEPNNNLASFGLETAVQSAPTQSHQPILTPGVQALTMRSEVLHFLAQPPEEGKEDHHFGEDLDADHADTDSSKSLEEPKSLATDTDQLSAQTKSTDHIDSIASSPEQTEDNFGNALDHSADDQQVTTKEQSTSNSASNLFKIIVLFLLALGIAAFFAQKTNDEHTDPPPPLQAVPDAQTQGADSNAKVGEQATNLPTPAPATTPIATANPAVNSTNASASSPANSVAGNANNSAKSGAPSTAKSNGSDEKVKSPQPASLTTSPGSPIAAPSTSNNPASN